MSNPVDWTYSVKDISGSTSIGVATVEALTNRYRVVSAAKQFSLFMLIALIFLPIPLMHFVFVPLFIVVAFVRAAMAFLGRQLITEFKTTCPACSNPLLWRNLKPKDSWREGCFNCRVVLTIERKH